MSEIERVQRELAAWAKDRPPHIRSAAERVLLDLWACANNGEVSPAMMRELAEHVVMLAEARASEGR